MKLASRGSHPPVETASEQQQQIRHGNNADKLLVVQDGHATYRSSSHDVGDPADRVRGFDGYDVTSHKIGHRASLPNGSPSSTAGVTLGQGPTTSGDRHAGRAGLP
jgi:hypothetical protein